MPSSEPLRLLFIEDASEQVELALREFARHKIPTAWQRVETDEQLELQLATFKPDVVLSDFTMPQYDGWSALARVRATNPDLPFLFVSGTIGEENAIEALRHGAMDYVLKDNLSRLVPAVTRARGEAELRREKQRAVQQLKDIVDTCLLYTSCSSGRGKCTSIVGRFASERTPQISAANSALKWNSCSDVSAGLNSRWYNASETWFHCGCT